MSDGLTFKILQMPDLHYSGEDTTTCYGPPPNIDCKESYMDVMMQRIVDDEKPDFVVFSGDQIETLARLQTPSHARQAVDHYSRVVIKNKLPWAMIFGNHDEPYVPSAALSTSKVSLMAYIQTLPYSLAQFGPKDIGGVGNYHLNIQSPQGKDILRTYYLDTGKQAQMTKGQLDYMKSLATQYSNQSVPALMFFHIPIPEYNEFVPGTGQGVKGEKVSDGANHDLWNAIVAMGDVKATFCGHDHYNDFCFSKQNVSLCYGGSSGYGWAYGSSDTANKPRTARVIEWTKTAEKETIDTWLYYHNQVNKRDKWNILTRHGTN
ncbi:Aste57867_3523 [Aphanomyces stellatus]|uniref:Aste57867_3523 protein n=1 Tax=Aphanomyces stellatus TaxID=120398 RepID=A0A485KDS4_9STRA|nr:hypothetical protein As57867_003512 [Aphanomyces stellatus]VFT80686.1 Aste57867_3523 [Aphanomyces stellatus]